MHLAWTWFGIFSVMYNLTPVSGLVNFIWHFDICGNIHMLSWVYLFQFTHKQETDKTGTVFNEFYYRILSAIFPIISETNIK